MIYATARARPERRRRLVRPARSRLCRVLRVRGVCLRDPLVGPVPPALARDCERSADRRRLGAARHLIGLPSRRLLGDYLAILTLFFGQAFVTLVSNADRITPPGFTTPVNFTGGPNGINGVDNIHSFGSRCSSVRGYYYFTLVVFVDRRGVPLLAQQVAHRAGVALAARGSAGRGADGDAGQPAEAARVHVRRRCGRTDRDALRRAPGRRLPRQLRASRC